jgi:hypothetical protein
MAEKSAFEILKEAKQKFYAPPMAPLNWRKPATVRVGAFDLTEKEIDELIAEFESSAPKEVKSGKNKGLEITFLTKAVNKVLSTTGISGISIGARDISIVARDYESARKRLQYLQSVSSRILSDGSLVYFVQDGERTANYTPEAYNKLVSDAEAAVKALEPESPQTLQGFGPTAKTYPDTPEGNLQKERDLIVQALAVQNERLANPITSRLNKNSIVKEINKLNQDLINIDKQISSPTTTPATTPTTTPATTPTTAPGTTPTTTTATTTTPAATTTTQPVAGVKVYTPEEVKSMLTAKPIAGGGTTGGGVKQTVVITKAQVDAKLVELGLEDTPVNRKTARQALKAGKPVAEDTSWEPIFKENYPQYNWMFTDLDRVKYADVFELFKFAQENNMPAEEFDRRYIGTSFYRELEASKKGRELSAAIGTFSWGSGQLAKFLTKAINFGYTGENLKQQAYTELFSKVDDKYVNDLAIKEVRASSPYLALKRIGTQYLTAFEDKTVEDALAGGMTADDLLRKSRELAKAMYPHLKDSIDAGVTLEDLAANYKQIAARTLELDPSQVDMGLKFNEALNYTRDGQARMLSLSEWETELRTNDKYKYSFTKQANQDATDIGLSIARAFGKVA